MTTHPARSRPHGRDSWLLALLACACHSTTDSTDTDATAATTTSDPTTTSESDTVTETPMTADASSTTMVSIDCGNGVVEGDEECDDANDDNTDDCTDTCRHATCGDGVVHEGIEECDDANLDDADECLGTCIAAVCGDGVTWGDMEACDDGRMNGTYGHCLAGCSGIGPNCGDGVRNGPEECDDANPTDDDDCSNDCFAPRIVFASADTFSGNLGGVAGADATCAQIVANSAISPDLHGAQWLAWISDGALSPTSPNRMDTAYGGYYKLTSGAVLARGWTELTNPPHAQPITVDENGNPVAIPLLAWSNTTPEGASIDDVDCNDWSTSGFAVMGRFGDVSANDMTWTDTPMGSPSNCSNSFHLYCFQNAPPP